MPLNDVDEFDVTAISDTDAAANKVAEDATIGDAVGITAQASDADATTNAITYTLDDDAGGRFAINGSTGEVTVNAALDYETNTSHSVTVRATSADGSLLDAELHDRGHRRQRVGRHADRRQRRHGG